MMLEIFFLVFLGGVLSLVGGFLLLAKQSWTPSFGEHLVSFAAGVLLSVAFFDLFPEAMEYVLKTGGQILPVFISAFIAMALFFILERFLLWYHHHHAHETIKPSVWLLMVGDSLHNFIDGVAIAASFLLDRSLGYITTLAVAAHELPQEMADFSVMLASKMERRKIIFLNILSSLTAFIGAGLTILFADALMNSLPIVLAFTAGMFIYIASSDLIPELHAAFTRRQSWRQFASFFLGVAATILSTTVLHQLLPVE